MSVLHFTNCHLADNGRLTREDLFVDTQSGIIVDAPTSRSGLTVETVDLNGAIISPGFIDIQINGCFGLDYSATFNEQREKAIFVNHYTESMKQLLQYGVTSIVPTVTSSFEQVYKDVLLIVGLKTRSSTMADSLGAHIEGPFISPEKKGCHPPETLTTMSNGYQSLKSRYGEDFEKYTAIMTAAPEVEGCLDIIHPLTSSSSSSNDIVFSIGHTMATFEQGIEAIKQGATMITHLYNAMPTNSARNPGIVGLTSIPKSILPADQIPYYGLVADGIHVHPSNIRASYWANPSKAILVTDAMYLIGLGDGVYERGDQKIEKKGHLLHLQGTDTIAGSATHLLQCVQNLMHWTGIPIEKALATITNNPARSLKISHRKGFLNKGCDADLVILSKDGDIKHVYKLGNKVQ